MTILQTVRDSALQNYGYLQGRAFALPSSFAELYGSAISTITSLTLLPLPFLSFLAVPIWGGSTTTVSLGAFWLVWATLLFSHGRIEIEFYSTLAVRGIFFVGPALVSLAFDLLVSNWSSKIKARKDAGLPGRLGKEKLLLVCGVAVGNVLLSVIFQAALEYAWTKIFHLRSLLRVSTLFPLPWTIFWDILKGLAIRGVAHYGIHRYLLHTYPSILKNWHLQWQHSIAVPFGLVAAYDHPVNYLLAVWLPAILPAFVLRWHVITWNLFLILVSVEEFAIYSGYSAMPSAILLPGMARRTEAHFRSVRKSGGVGNFGHIGIMDWLIGTSCEDEVTILDDVQNEAEKRQFQERINEAVKIALESRDKNEKEGGAGEDADAPLHEGAADGQAPSPRKFGRRKGAKR